MAPLGSLLERTATAAWPIAVLLCAGAYVSGADGSNECPAGSGRIEAEAACRAAAAAAGKPFMLVGTYAAYPRGCYYLASSNNAVFNTHAVGAGYSNYLLLCAALAVTTGAPPPHRAEVRARVYSACAVRCV